MTRVLEHNTLASAFAETAETLRAGSPGDLAGKVQAVGPVTALRQSLNLERGEFAARFYIPLEMLTEWEQGKSEPDAVAKVFLSLIASDPQGVAKRLAVQAAAAE